MARLRVSELPLPEEAVVYGVTSTEVSGISLDSRETHPEDIYAALPGANVHGARFAVDLIHHGIRVILTDCAGHSIITTDLEPEYKDEVTYVIVDNPRRVVGAIAAAVYETTDGAPQLLGVTGTNGKTTTVFLLDAILENLGRITGVVGTVGTMIAGKRTPGVRTTPEAPTLHSLFREMRGAGVDICAMEVSSHALVQHRVSGARFNVVGFTNLSQDHLDFHDTMEDYYQAKAELFTHRYAKRGVIVLADDYARRLARESEIPVWTISRRAEDEPDFLIAPSETENSDFMPVAMHRRDSFTLIGPGGFRVETASPLPGFFNQLNTALALVMTYAAGIGQRDIAAVAASLQTRVPGRMDVVNEHSPQVIVDYSHTPQAITEVLAGLAHESKPLVIVFGAGGDRDQGKRFGMGHAAACEADIMIITDDNPRSEDPAAIRAAILAGAQAALHEGSARVSNSRIWEIGDRAAAIRAGIAAASPEGTLVIAGKGHETGQEIDGVVYPFDDAEQTREALASERVASNNGKVQD